VWVAQVAFLHPQHWLVEEDQHRRMAVLHGMAQGAHQPMVVAALARASSHGVAQATQAQVVVGRPNDHATRAAVQTRFLVDVDVVGVQSRAVHVGPMAQVVAPVGLFAAEHLWSLPRSLCLRSAVALNRAVLGLDLVVESPRASHPQSSAQAHHHVGSIESDPQRSR